jgi:hypothetical protein
MTQDAKLAFLENEVHRLTELVRLYAEGEKQKRMENQGFDQNRPISLTITPDEVAFARDMAISASKTKSKKRA